MRYEPAPAVIKHYLKGEFNKDYDRLIQVKSVTAFLQVRVGSFSRRAGLIGL